MAAIFAYDPRTEPPGESALVAVRDAMAARGPDGAGIWFDAGRRVGLAHRRLAIIDLSAAGAQPMVDAAGELAVTFNGEIYNYRALRAELEQAGARFRTGSDTEVLLHLYRRHGIAMLERLRGMFAFALWDGARRGLLLARDPFGIKPLYVADDGGTLRAASQVRALLAGGGIDTTPDPAGHAGFFLWGSVPEPHTLYRGISALAAGTWLWRGQDGERRQGRFFDLAAELAGGVSAKADEPGRLRAALADSVAAHLVADVPVGVFLSSGLDSATLTALAAESAGEVRTLTLGFAECRGTPRDEVPLAEVVAARYGARHVTRWVTAADFAEGREDILAAMDQPSIDGVNTWLVAREAKRAGLKVALSGLGGDELFAGYDTFRRVPTLMRRLGPLRHAPWLGRAARHLLAPFGGRLPSPKLAGLFEYGPTLGGAYLLSRGLFMPWELDGVLDADLARAGLEALAAEAGPTGLADGLAAPRLAVSAMEMGWYMRNQLLRDADWAGMAHGVEIRVPLVDTGLLRAVAPLLAGPAAPGKLAMAGAPALPLPAEVLARHKSGFFVPVAEWMGQGDTGLRGWARHVHRRFVASA